MKSRIILALVVLVGCEEPPPPAPVIVDGVDPPIGDSQRGADLVLTYECARCHAGVAGAPDIQQRCAGCHEDILDGTLEVPEGEHWRENIHSLPSAPDLSNAHRFSPVWIAEYLQRPRDLRPHLEATMPRLPINERDARDLAAYLTRHATEKIGWEYGVAERGKTAASDRACGGCHLAGGEPIGDTPPLEGLARILAPDLAITARRFRHDMLVDWLVDPTSIHPTTLMPPQGLECEEAKDIAAWLATLVMPTPAPAPDRLPVLDREVRFEEVETQVFRAVCWHCHADPDLAMGDGGPGNTGGFGFEARRVNLGEYESISSGALNEEGRRASLFREVTLAGETMPLLVATLRARQLEEAGVEHDGPRGMPLGLPAMSPEAIQLVETWIAGGRQR